MAKCTQGLVPLQFVEALGSERRCRLISSQPLRPRLDEQRTTLFQWQGGEVGRPPLQHAPVRLMMPMRIAPAGEISPRRPVIGEKSHITRGPDCLRPNIDEGRHRQIISISKSYEGLGNNEGRERCNPGATCCGKALEQATTSLLSLPHNSAVRQRNCFSLR